MNRCLACLILLVVADFAPAGDMPLFDAHIHYSHDAWDVISPQQAVAALRDAGIIRALVSSSNDDGTQRLYAAAPDLVIPSLRPYRKRGELATWVRDESVVAYIEERLQKYRYAAIGEFHVYGADADLPVVRRIVNLAKLQGLLLHVHSDTAALERIFRQDPDARVLWAHAGFEQPQRVEQMMLRYPRLWADLSMRSDVAENDKLDPGWWHTLLAFPDRFMIGTDTYTPERWQVVASEAAWARRWLADLPADVAERIAYRNGEVLLRSTTPNPRIGASRGHRLTTTSSGLIN